jgi:hypothetical protein
MSLIRKMGISSETKIKCNGSFMNFKEILLENEIDYSDIEASDLNLPIFLKKPLLINLSCSDIEVKEIYYAGYNEFKSLVLDNGIQEKISTNQPLLFTTFNYNLFSCTSYFKNADKLLIYKNDKFSTARILSNSSIGLQATWSPFRYSNNAYITESGLILN